MKIRNETICSDYANSIITVVIGASRMSIAGHRDHSLDPKGNYGYCHVLFQAKCGLSMKGVFV